jgi:hypothetical protein
MEARRGRARGQTHLRSSVARRLNWSRLRTTRTALSRTSSPRLHGREKTTIRVMMQKVVTARSSRLATVVKNDWVFRAAPKGSAGG